MRISRCSNVTTCFEPLVSLDPHLTCVRRALQAYSRGRSELPVLLAGDLNGPSNDVVGLRLKEVGHKLFLGFSMALAGPQEL